MIRLAHVRSIIVRPILASAFVGLAGAALADPPPHPPATTERPALAQSVPPNPLPPDVTTEHVVTVAGRTLRFKATAGSIRLADAGSGAPLADIAYVAFRLDTPDARTRPLTVALNGGPGAASAWLDLGGIGPWRLPVDVGTISPSMPVAVVDNPDTWLDATDLLFIDPLGTGYSRVLAKGDEATKSFWSVDGDIAALATVVRKWLVAADRLGSPLFVVGESYGGFRAPKLARRLARNEGVGVSGLVMVSPVLDFAWFQAHENPAIAAGRFPSLVAAARGVKGTDPRAALKDAEAFAAGPYLTDLFAGRRDGAAVARASRAMAPMLGVDEAFVRRYGARPSAGALARERLAGQGRVASAYDALVTGFDPDPSDFGHRDDPVLDALKTPMAAAMAGVTAGKLGWPVQAPYQILNNQVTAHWDWDTGREPAEATGDLAALLALDPKFRAIVMHGVTDEVTPYFTTKLLLDQIPAFGDADRLRLAVYGGGHMFYLDDSSRAAMHADARRLIEAPR